MWLGDELPVFISGSLLGVGGWRGIHRKMGAKEGAGEGGRQDIRAGEEGGGGKDVKRWRGRA